MMPIQVLAKTFAAEHLQPDRCMKEPSDKRKRILALHDRALRFSTGVNTSCPNHFSERAQLDRLGTTRAGG